MKVERYSRYSSYGSIPSATMRILETSCPLCKRHVCFALNDDEYIASEVEYLNKQNNDLRHEIIRLNVIIDRIITGRKIKGDKKCAKEVEKEKWSLKQKKN